MGTPTWNTGADTERSGTGWDEIYYTEMQNVNNVAGKKVAVFGLGDSVSYSENYADATGEVCKFVFVCEMIFIESFMIIFGFSVAKSNSIACFYGGSM